MQTTPKNLESAGLWSLKILTGLLILVLLVVHFVINHTVAQGGLMSYADVVKYLSNPWIAFMELSFLTFVVSHSLLGLRGIILDLNPGQKLVRLLDRFFLLVGIGAIVYGIWLTREIASRAAGG